MLTNTAYSAPKAAHRSTIHAGRFVSASGFTPERAVIAVACIVAVFLMIMGIVHVAEKQVSKGPILNNDPKTAAASVSVYSSNDGTRLSDLERGLTRTSFER